MAATENKEAPKEARVLYFHGKRGYEYDGFPNHDLVEREYRMFFGNDDNIDRLIAEKLIPFAWEQKGSE
jgi:hypothetical protein